MPTQFALPPGLVETAHHTALRSLWGLEAEHTRMLSLRKPLFWYLQHWIVVLCCWDAWRQMLLLLITFLFSSNWMVMSKCFSALF